MREWLAARFGISLEEAIAIVTLAVAILLPILAPVRRAARKRFQGLGFALGRPQRRYAQWFAAAYGTYDNPYLDDAAGLKLTDTFVSLYFVGESAVADARRSATEALDDEPIFSNGVPQHAMIEGDPGSGKSTLLRVYGLNLARAQLSASRVAAEDLSLPFLVPCASSRRSCPGRAGPRSSPATSSPRFWCGQPGSANWRHRACSVESSSAASVSFSWTDSMRSPRPGTT